MGFRFEQITASGTFDRLHKGHKAFLKKAFTLGKHVLVGITSDDFIKDKKGHLLIEPFKKRQKRVLKFLARAGLGKRATIIKLEDVYGPTVEKDTKIAAILVTAKTVQGAEIINARRIALGLAPLAVVKIDLIRQKSGKAISSSSQRKETDILNHTLILPRFLRETLKKPKGILIKGDEKNLQEAMAKAKKVLDSYGPTYIITVGDVVSKSFNEASIPIDLVIVDFKIKREEAIYELSELGFSKNTPDETVENLPGTVAKSLSESIARMLDSMPEAQPHIIKVLGEEDLAVLPAIVLAKVHSIVVYGQPLQGIVLVKVTDALKRSTVRLLNQFTKL